MAKEKVLKEQEECLVRRLRLADSRSLALIAWR